MDLQATQLPPGDFRSKIIKADLGTSAEGVNGVGALPEVMVRLVGVNQAVDEEENSDGAV